MMPRSMLLRRPCIVCRRTVPPLACQEHSGRRREYTDPEWAFSRKKDSVHICCDRSHCWEAGAREACRMRFHSTCRPALGTVHLRTGRKFECQAHLGKRLQGVVEAVSRGMRETSARMWEIYRISNSHLCWQQ